MQYVCWLYNSILWMYLLNSGYSLTFHCIWGRSLEASDDGSFTNSSCKLGLCECLSLLVWILKVLHSLTLFFHVFRFLRGPVSNGCNRGLIYLELTVHDFRPLLELHPFEDRFFLVTPIRKETHSTIFVIGDGVEEDVSICFLSTRLRVTFLWGKCVCL